jgi:hypothetical protein
MNLNRGKKLIWKIIGAICSLSFFVTGFSVLGNPDCVTAEIGGGRVIGVTCRPDTYGTWSGGAAGSMMLLIGTALLVFVFWRELRNIVSPNFQASSQSTRMASPTSRTTISKNTFSSGSSLKSEKKMYKQCSKCNSVMRYEWGHCSKCLSNKLIDITEEEMLAVSDSTSSNVCKYCKQEIPAESQQCPNCFPEQTYTKEYSQRICMYCKKKYSMSLKECPTCFPEPITRTAKPAKPPKKQVRPSPSISSEEAMWEVFNESKVEAGNVSNPEFKTCPMCAEDIKFAAKKCRYCQHMMEA